MFERYTEKARRVIFFSRYEAAQFGSPFIETEHLLLGILREDKALTNRFLRSHAAVESIRKQIENHTTKREKVSTSVDLPLTDESKRILKYAQEESERLSNRNIGPEHLFLGIMREEKCFAAGILQERGVKLASVREELARAPNAAARAPEDKAFAQALAQFSRDLIQEAIDLKLDPLVGRDEELMFVIEALCSLNYKNPVLIGERGAGKTAIIEGLAQRVADGEVPSFLADKRILAFDPQLMVGWTRDRQKFEERMNLIVKSLTNTPDVIMFIDELQTLFEVGSTAGSFDAAAILRSPLLRGEIQCISTCTPGDYKRMIGAAPWLGRCFRAINVFPLDEAKALRVLYGRKEQYEKFHGVAYTDDALQFALSCSSRYFPDSPLLAKATEILDTAGSRVKLRQTSLPEDVTEVQKRIKFIVHRMENAIANHEFEKARFYSDEERKERENLAVLREKYHLDESSTGVVGPQDIEEVVSRWTGQPIAAAGEDPTAPPVPQPANPLVEKSPTFRVFLCHSSKDKPAVRNLYKRLKDNDIDPWLDTENLLPGQKWDYEISRAVRSSHVVIVCLSAHTNKAGYLQKEIKKVLDVADQQPEGTIYLIPLKLEECEVPDRLQDWQWVNLFDENGFEKLMRSLFDRAGELGLSIRGAK
jgi:ATP-dependent Clp protease ATP-binding subunit ClpC